MNQNIRKERISVAGYSERDLNMYYNGCYLLTEGDELFRWEHFEDGKAISTLGGDVIRIRPDKLYRFLIPQGLYITRDGKLFAYQYLQSRSYKKALDRQYMKAEGAHMMNHHSVMKAVLEDRREVNVNGKHVKKISDRLAIRDGKLITMYNLLSIGSVNGTSVDSPFPAVHQRMEQHYAQQHR